MDILEFQKQAKRTCPDLGGDKFNLPHMALGIFSEFNELWEAHEKKDQVNIAEELADMMWYVVNYCTFRNISAKLLPLNIVKDIEAVSFVVAMSKLQDLVKKNMAYGKAIDVLEEMEQLRVIYSGVNHLCNINEINLNTAYDKNIEKLKVRYPEKFTEDNAINRNLDKEREALT